MKDNKMTLYCPACGKEMKKVFIQESGVNIDICVDGCGGIYFDNRELEKFDEKHENADAIFAALEGREFSVADSTQPRICPACGAQMAKVGAAGGSIEIDACYTCGGKFLDLGELQKIRNYDNNDINFDNIIDGIFDSLHSDIVKPGKSSPRRQFFENLIRKYF